MFLQIFMPLFLFGLLAQLGTAVANDEGGFRDCAECPEMVVVPAGSFEMGSPPDEAERGDHEGPLHEVTLQNFAIGKHEVTFDEWDACVAAGGCSHDPDDEGWGRGNHPVINVSWEDTQEYVRWLSDRTGETYRLPSESEWEYAARAGTTTRFAFGERMTEEQGNIWPHLMKTTVIGSYL